MLVVIVQAVQHCRCGLFSLSLAWDGQAVQHCGLLNGNRETLSLVLYQPAREFFWRRGIGRLPAELDFNFCAPSFPL
jgi:hypothetical protein